MAVTNSSTELDSCSLETDFHAMGMMMKGLYEIVGTCLEERDVEALTQQFKRLESKYISYSQQQSDGVNHA